MKGYNIRPVEIDTIRTDGGTQVRERLDDAWVEELADLYREDHEIDPVLVVIDGAGVVWLVDGFHRVEAQRRLGRSSIKATVRSGPTATLDFAKMLAAEANKNGRPLLPGDKRRAVLMARSTPEGAKMGVRELARHCGVTHSYVLEVEGRSVVTTAVPSNRSVASKAVQARLHADLYARVDAAIRADPERDSEALAADLGCGVKVVYGRRAALGLLKPKKNGRAAAEALLRDHPEWPNARIADEAGSSPETVAKLRSDIGLPPSTRGPKPKEAPSAPSRKGGDARDDAEVIQLRPQGPAPGTKHTPTKAERDALRVLLHHVDTHARIVSPAFLSEMRGEVVALLDRIMQARGAA